MNPHLPALQTASAPPRARRHPLLRWLVIGWLLVLAGLHYWQPAPARVPADLVMDLDSSATSVAQAFFDTGKGFNAEESVTVPIAQGLETQTLVFSLPAGVVRAIRFDPLTVAGTVHLRHAVIRRSDHQRELYPIDLGGVTALHEIAQLTSRRDGVEIVTTPDSGDSQVRLPLAGPVDTRTTVNERVAYYLLADGGVTLLVLGIGLALWFAEGFRLREAQGRQRLRRVVGRWFPDGFAWLAFTLLPAVSLLYLTVTSANTYYLEATIAADRPADVFIYWDEGAGFTALNYTRAAVKAGADLQTVRFPIPGNRLVGVRFDPAEGPVVMRVGSLAIRSDAEDWLHRAAYYSLDLNKLQALNQIKELTHGNDGVKIVAEGDVNDPYAAITLPSPVTLGLNGVYLSARCLEITVVWLLIWLAVGEGWPRRPEGARRAVARCSAMFAAGWRRLLPAQAIWLVAAVCVVLSCYPVIFLGKSFAGVNFKEGTFQLYQKFPTLPGTTDAALESGRGADLGPMAWQNAPYDRVEGRALFHDGELPLWNRYNQCGLPLLGQGQSMFGDPLNFIVLAASGAAWAWDFKFLLAKLLFAAGVGFTVWAATAFLPAALLVSFSSAFIGFFAYRLNHPAYFSLCYAPWIIFAWIRIAGAPVRRAGQRWAGVLILANWMELNSGTAKEAYMLLLWLNLTGLGMLLFNRDPWRTKAWRFVDLAGAGVIYCLLASPILLVFFDTLKHAVSGYDVPHAWQLQPGLFIGLFDDIFYRQFNSGELQLDPSANFLVLLGVLLALSRFKGLIGDRVFVAVLLGAMLPLWLVFGVVPSKVIRAVPFLGNIIHIDNTFSCVLLIHLFVLAGYGLKDCLVNAADPSWPRDVLVAFLLGGVLLGVYFGGMNAAQRSDVSFLKLDQEIPCSLFFWGYVPTLVAALLILPFVLRRLCLHGPAVCAGMLLFACLFLLHWRLGIQAHGPLSRYTPVLPDRMDLLARSPVIDFLHADQTSPFRAVGYGENFAVGYGDTVAVETVNGPDALVNPYYAELETVGMKLDRGWKTDQVDREQLPPLKPFYDLLNIRYYLAPSDVDLNNVPNLTLAGRFDLDAYRSPTAWPRAFFVDRLGVYHGVTDFAAQVTAGDGRPFAAVDSDELHAQPELAGRFPAGQAGRKVAEASHYRLTNNRTFFDVEAPGPGVVVLGETFMADDFVAELNGHPVPVFRVNHAFRGILVDRPGSYHVTFAYQPKHLKLTLWAAALGLALLGGAGVRLYRTPGASVLPDGPGRMDRFTPVSATLVES